MERADTERMNIDMRLLSDIVWYCAILSDIVRYRPEVERQGFHGHVEQEPCT